MKRWTLRIVLFLVLGGILNVAVAWTSAVAGQQDSPWSHHTCDDTLESIAASGALPHYQHSKSWVRSTLRTKVKTVIVIAGDSDDEPAEPGGPWSERSIVVRAGWPMCGMLGELWQVQNGDQELRMFQSALDGGAWTNHTSERPVPLQPIWPGFAINTVFYAATLWMLFAAPFALRCRLRRKHGLCPACAYDLRGNPPQSCPECGRSVASIGNDALRQRVGFTR